MILNKKLESGKIIVEVSVISPERFLNILCSKNIKAYKINRINITTVRLEIDYNDYEEVVKEAKNLKGKTKIIGKQGMRFFISSLKNKLSLVIGLIFFIGVLYILSTRIWAVEIDTKENVTPFEIRKELTSLGVTPGISKDKINVYDLEKKIQDINSDILWIRARIEGSTLKIILQEKVTPPQIEQEAREGDCIAKVGGEIKRIYVSSGTAKVSVGDFVNEGDVLITAIQGREGDEYSVEAKGSVIANTFYEKEMEIQVNGTRIENTGNTDSDIYLNLWGNKIYLKKAINNFKYYDKINNNEGFFNKVTYFERSEKEVNLNRDEAIKEGAENLEKSLIKSLSNDAKITNKDISIQDLGDGKIRVKVMFIVEQDIIANPN
ncbi:sporulation protein YqfD [uncultured Clostridium sp.]|uniref:sporulation protein YqfD n=1 Tax=uncultured Clostridium sp. TaxID=59620 RepID=UPI0025EA6BA8|nr:sporulation protein YqfD [uncultured Clostridium sp.]